MDGFTIAVIAAAAVNIIIAMLWYHPNFFGRAWVFSHGFREDSLKAGIKEYLGATIVALVIAYVLGMMLKELPIHSIASAVTFTFWVWLGFIATTHFSGVLWAKKPLKAYLIDMGFYLVSFEAMALIFSILS